MVRLDFSRRSWARVILWTTLGTLFCIAVSLGVDSFNFMQLDAAARGRAITNDILLPLLLAPPIIFFLTSKLRELAIAHHELSILASTDSLTGLLNRRVFTTLVDAYLERVRDEERRSGGALLVIDADNFKAINDSLGHDRGDEALRLIASTISGALRSVDLVGRIGGEEFGVFLPDTSAVKAEAVAERIRQAINDTAFSPEGERRRLSVSLGGAVFERYLPFHELFREADQQLYLAKQAGRNRFSITRAPARVAAAMAAA